MTDDVRIGAVVETFPVAGTFTISRGSRTEATVVVASVTGYGHTGRGECVPYARYGETIDSVLAQISGARDVADRATLQARLPPGAARNALDCAFWDLEAKCRRRPVADLAGIAPAPLPQLTCYTLSLDSPDAMAAAAREAGDRPLLKLKLGADGDADRMRAVRAARPDARLVADANEAWRIDQLTELLAVGAEAGFEVIEQPLPACEDAALSGLARPIPICADESVHTAADLDRVASLYDAVNVKLDKAGGLTEAITMARSARERGLKVMAGCMLSTSLAMAPALLLAPLADWLDLDGPLLLARDRLPAIGYRGGHIVDVPDGLWG